VVATSLAQEEELVETDMKSVQIMFRMPSLFMQRFDRVTESMGYSRTGAIREAMRRFQSELQEEVSGRPEEAAKQMQAVMEGILSPLLKLGQQPQAQNALPARPPAKS
jgi:hypothetical protein